jgi:hypothetical protein
MIWTDSNEGMRLDRINMCNRIMDCSIDAGIETMGLRRSREDRKQSSNHEMDVGDIGRAQGKTRMCGWWMFELLPLMFVASHS